MLMLTTVLAAALAVPPGAGPAPQACPRIEVRQARAQRARRAQVFSAREVGDLELVVSYPRTLAREKLELWLLTPSGSLYQKLKLELPPLRRRDPWGRASATLPVSGTLIASSALFGVWTVQPALAGTPLDCRAPERFTLER